MGRTTKSIDTGVKDRLEKSARETRRDVLKMIHNAGSGNPGSALSCVEILVWLMQHEMEIRANEPRWPMRDRLILSKGHAAPVFYSIASQIGWISKDHLFGFRRFNTKLQTHPEYDTLECIDYTSGSLGQGLSVACGMAVAAQYQSHSEPRFFVLLGDGEMQEGQVWEAIMTAGHYGLGGLTAILDRNRFQGDRAVSDVMDIEPIAEKMRAFKWDVQNADGHSFESLSNAHAAMSRSRPKLIIANTVKGRGVSFMEGDNAWHVGGKKFTQEFLARALRDLEG